MSKAKQAADQPSKDVQDILKHLPELSKSAQSESRTDLIFDDGTALTMTSFDGAPVTTVHRQATEAEMATLAAQKKANAPVT